MPRSLQAPSPEPPTRSWFPPAHIKIEGRPIERKSDQPKRILIVEDEFLIALDAGEALRAEGYDVVGVATTFEEALALAETARPDLVLMDIRLLSAKDGIDAAIEIRKRFDIPSLFTSANDDAANIARAEPAAPVGWVPKPYAFERLMEAIRRVLYVS